MKAIVAVLAIALFLVSCKAERPSGEAAAPETAAATAAPTGAAAPAASEPNLLGFASGALIVRPPENQGWFDGSYGPYNMLDDNTTNQWASQEGSAARPQVMVVAVPAATEFTRFEFDTIPADDDAVKNVRIEVSNESADAGFVEVATAALEKAKDAQSVAATSAPKARWVRFTFSGSDGGDQLALGNIRAFGRQEAATSLQNVSGTYQFEGETPWHIQAEGSSITGCYEGNYEGLISGGVEGQTMKLRWTENTGRAGAMLVNYAPGGEAAVFHWRDGEDPQKPVGPNIKYGKKTSDEIGSCDHWSPNGTIDQQLAGELEKKGRAIVYGINFDTDSDVIRADSKPTLDKIVALLKAKRDWKLSIEGHTDSTASAEHNQRLSERRAASVKSYLVSAGIEDGRLTTSGRGAGNPVAPNDTPTGRAQNRRVELVKL